MRWYHKLDPTEREIIEHYTEGEFKLLRKSYREIRNKYYFFGLIPRGREVTPEDREKLKTLSDKITSFHSVYSSQHPGKTELNTQAIEITFSIRKILESN